MSWTALAMFFGLVAAAAFLGGQWGAREWYANLRKPGFTPPNWVFPVVWPVLYTMVAISGWRVFESGSGQSTVALALWTAQLALNAAWSYFFFGRKKLGVALADLTALWIVNAAYIAVTSGIDTWACVLFVPYTVWTGYAAALNFRILQLNVRGEAPWALK